MSKEEVTVHMVVRNEDQFIWYAISSIINYVKRVIIYDTGSTDKTVDIIKSFKSQKITFEEKRNINAIELVKLRQEQIKKTETDWIWIVDGDEIYPRITVEEILDYINSRKDYKGGVVRRYDLLGDIYHYQREDVGAYNLLGHKGHLVLRLINIKKIPNLRLQGIYPYEGYFDEKGKSVIDYPPKDFFFTKNKIFHAMYLKRSSLGGKLQNTLHRNKYKIETGYELPPTTNFPEVFFYKRPVQVPDMTKPRNATYDILASLVTPVKKVKRKIWEVLE